MQFFRSSREGGNFESGKTMFDMRKLEAQGRCAGCGRCACGLGGEGVSAAEVPYLLMTYEVRA